MTKMKAIQYSEYGEPDVLELVEVDRPVPDRNELLVRVRAAGVNPPDWKLRRQAYPGYTLPLIPGYDVSGVVEDVGGWVGRFEPGDEVFGMLKFPVPAHAYAEYVVARPRQFARKPAGIDHRQAAALPMAGLTAWQGFEDVRDVKPGDRVLVHAAAGGVGHMAVQLAKRRGAYVIGTARAAKHDFLRGLGIDEVIDYTTVDFTEAVSDVDLVFDSAGGDYPRRSLSVLRKGGAYVAAAGATEEEAEALREAGVHYRQFQVEPDHTALAGLTGQVTAHVDRVFPLAEAAKAHQVMEAGTFVGKIVLDVT